MDKELKAKWTSALRSRKWKQGRKRFVTRSEGGNRFCCLGVLGRMRGVTIKQLRACNTDLFVPGLATDVIPEGALIVLTKMNDGTDGYKKHNFRQIADWIDANL